MSDETAFGLIGCGVVLVGLVALILGALVMGWFGEAARQVSVGNVRAQWQFAYECDENLQSAGRQVCLARQAVSAAADHDEQVQLRSAAETYALNYSRIQAECNAKYRNAFENKYIRPSDAPDHAAELNEMLARLCPRQ